MATRIAVLISYFLVVLGIGFIARTRWKSSPETYFLADRKLGTLILLGTMRRLSRRLCIFSHHGLWNRLHGLNILDHRSQGL
jgi:hypothetical protein